MTRQPNCRRPREGRQETGQAEARSAIGQRLVLFVGNPTLVRKRFALAKAVVEGENEWMPVEMVVGWKVPRKQIPVFMSACDALIFTSLQEGSPNAVKESLACDLPVVSVPGGDVSCAPTIASRRSPRRSSACCGAAAG